MIFVINKTKLFTNFAAAEGVFSNKHALCCLTEAEEIQQVSIKIEICTRTEDKKKMLKVSYNEISFKWLNKNTTISKN